MKLNSAFPFERSPAPAEAPQHLQAIVAYLQEARPELIAEFARRLHEARWLDSLGTAESSAEATLLYDEYLKVLESGRKESLQDCAGQLSNRLLARGVDFARSVGVVRLLRSLVDRSLFDHFRHAAN